MNIFLSRAITFFLILAASMPLIVSETYSPFVLGKAIWFRSIVWVMSVFVGILILRNKNMFPEKNLGFLLFGILIIIQIFSSIFGYSIINSFWGNMNRMQGLIQSIHLLIFSLILFSFLRNMHSWINVFKLIIGIGLLVSIIGLLESFNIYIPNFINSPFSIKTLEQPFEGISSTLGNPVYLSWYLSITTIISIALITLEYKKEGNFFDNLISRSNIFLLSSIFFSTWCILVNFSRSTIISLLLGLIFFMGFAIYLINYKKLKIAISLIMLLILASPSILLLTPKIDSDAYEMKYEIVLEKIPELRDFELIVRGKVRPNYLSYGGIHQLDHLNINYLEYSDPILEKRILNDEVSQNEVCSDDVLFQKWLMGIQSSFRECTKSSILLNKIPGNIGKSLIHGFHVGHRSMTTNSGINSWLKNPLFGIGSQNFYIDYFKEFTFDDFLKSENLIDDPHNSIIKILAENGALGLIASVIFFSYIFILSIKKIFNSKNKLFWLLISTLLITYFCNSLLQFSSLSNQLLMSFVIAFLVRSDVGFDNDRNNAVRKDEINKNKLIYYLPIIFIILVISLYSNYMIFLSSSRMNNSTYEISEFQKNVNLFPSLSTEPRTEMIRKINEKLPEFIDNLDYVVEIVNQEYNSSLKYQPYYYPLYYEFGLFYYEASKYKPELSEKLVEITNKLQVIAPDIQPTLDIKIRESIISGDNDKFKNLYFEWKKKIGEYDGRMYGKDKDGNLNLYDTGLNFYDEYYSSLE